MILCLFHGNADVERGFSVNKYCLSENLSEESLIARRIVWEKVSLVKGAINVDLNKSLLNYCKNASTRRRDFNKRKNEENEEKQMENIRKKKFQTQLAVLEEEKAQMMKTMLKRGEEIDMKISELTRKEH